MLVHHLHSLHAKKKISLDIKIKSPAAVAAKKKKSSQVKKKHILETENPSIVLKLEKKLNNFRDNGKDREDLQERVGEAILSCFSSF